MTLPEIPDEATATANAAMVCHDTACYDPTCTGCMVVVSVVLAAAWPHLYTAALEDAASRLDYVWTWTGSAGRPGDVLRLLAAEAMR